MTKALTFLLGISFACPSIAASASKEPKDRTASCASRISKWRRPALLLGGGLIASITSYAGFEAISTDPVVHSYVGTEDTKENKAHIALIGDSLSTDFTYQSDLPTLFALRTIRVGGWFVDRKTNAAPCFAERCADIHSIRADSHARAGASIEEPAFVAFGKKLGQTANMPEQVNELLSGKSFPDQIYIWIGHNDADFVHICSKDDALNEEDVCARLPGLMREQMRKQLERLAARARNENKPVAITVFGLMNLKSAIEVREKIVQDHKDDPSQYPYLPRAIEGFPTLMPEHEKLASELTQNIDREWRAMVEELNKEYEDSQVRFFFSPVFSDFEFSQEDISTIDGLHLSPEGSTRLGQAAFDATQEQRDFTAPKQP